MVIREQITTRAAGEQVWPLISDPVRMAEWNPKIVAVDRQGTGCLQLGERFRAIYRMSGRDRETDCEVTELQHLSLIVIRHRPVEGAMDSYVNERYRLEPVREGTKLVQEIDLSRSGIPRVVQLLMWIIHRTGRPTGKRYFETLKEIVERQAHPAHA